MKKYDFLIVGSGLFGAVFAYEATKRGKTCLVIEKRNHIGGNVYTEKKENIYVHKYGAHIFHTSNEKVWRYMNKFCKFNNFVNSPLANYNGEIYNLPFNMNTFYQIFKISSPEQVKKQIDEQAKEYRKTEPKNLEEKALSLVGRDIYEKLIKGYTQKQWGRPCSELPAFIINRIPLRFTYDNNYFNDTYQGIPIGGYTKIFEKMLKKCDVLLNTDYFDFIKQNKNVADKTVYTGQIDKFYNYEFGPLDWRCVRFESETLDTENYQGVAVMNFTSSAEPYTRIIEHKHFDRSVNSNKTIISKEFSKEWKLGDEPYYPVNDDKNNNIYKKYLEKSKKDTNVIFGGRLGTYKYCNMDEVIFLALEKIKEVFGD